MPLSVASHLIGATTRPEATVLDPMAGSGTTLIAARLLGRLAFGFDLDPLAVLVGREARETVAGLTVAQLAHFVTDSAIRSAILKAGLDAARAGMERILAEQATRDK
jgi:DNA modification methylase